MRVPFYHQHGHGLYVTERQLWWAELRRSGDDVTLHRLASQPVGESGTKEEALQELTGQLEPRPQAVVTHLDPGHVRCFVAERSEGGSEERWMQETARSHLPTGASLEDFVACGRPLREEGGQSRSGQTRKYLLALARQEAVEDRKVLCRAAGLTPLIIGDLRTDLCFAHSFDPSFIEESPPALLLHGDKAWVLRHQSGVPSEAPTDLGFGGENRLEDALLHVAGGGSTEAPSRMLVAGEGAASATAKAGRSGWNHTSQVTPQPAAPKFGSGSSPSASSSLDTERPEEGLKADGNLLGDERLAEAAPALAFATKALYPEADPINFLSEEATRSARDEADRQEVLRAGLWVGGTFALLLLAATALNMYFQRQSARLSAQAGQSDRRLEQVEKARQTQNRLLRRLQKSRALVRGQTRTAPVLSDVGQAIPRGIWLEEMIIERLEGDTLAIELSGFGTREANVATLLSRLENRPRLRQVDLQYSKILPDETVHEQTGQYREVLNRFSVEALQAPPSTQPISQQKPRAPALSDP